MEVSPSFFPPASGPRAALRLSHCYARAAGPPFVSGNLNMKIPLMQADKFIETEGKIVAVLAGTMFRVELANQHQILAHISGKMRKRFIRLTNGDRVKLEMSPYDLDKGRIVYRLG